MCNARWEQKVAAGLVDMNKLSALSQRLGNANAHLVRRPQSCATHTSWLSPVSLAGALQCCHMGSKGAAARSPQLLSLCVVSMALLQLIAACENC